MIDHAETYIRDGRAERKDAEANPTLRQIKSFAIEVAGKGFAIKPAGRRQAAKHIAPTELAMLRRDDDRRGARLVVPLNDDPIISGGHCRQAHTGSDYGNRADSNSE